MSSEVGSMRPNPYLFDIENRKKRRPRLAHDLGAGAKCNKCGDKCPGFELHFWRKICMNCRCSKDDHEVEDDEEDIGRIVIGKLFDRPARTEREELEYCHGNSLEMVNEETGKAENVKFDWVPPNVEKTLASRYMELLPPDKRPVAGTEAAKARRRQLEQQVPLYDMDATQRSDSLPPEELQNFLAYLEKIRTQVVGQGSVQEIIGAPAPSYAQPLKWQSPSKSVGVGSDRIGDLDANGNIGYYPDTHTELTGMAGQGALDDANVRNNNVNVGSMTQTPSDNILGTMEPRRGSTQMPNLRLQFLGGMVGEPAGIPGFKTEEPVHSVPYGSTRMASRPLQGSRNDNLGQGILDQLSDLSVHNRTPGDSMGQGPLVPGLPPTLPGQGESNRSNSAQGFYSAGPKGYRPVTPTFLNQGNQTDIPGEPKYSPDQLGQPGNMVYQPKQPDNKGYKSGPGDVNYQAGQHGMTGYQPDQYGDNEYKPGQPGNTSQNLGQPNFQHSPLNSQLGKADSLPGQRGVPAHQVEGLGKTSYQADQVGNQPGQTSITGPQPSELGYLPVSQQHPQRQPVYQPGKPNLGDNQTGAQLYHQPGQIGTQPSYPLGQHGYIPTDSDTIINPHLNWKSDGQEFPPPPPELLAFSGEQPGSDSASLDSGVEVYDNVGAKLRAKIDEEARTPLQKMMAMERNIPVASGDAIQAPYTAQLDTLTGGISIAPGRDVNVLFPGESQLIGSQAKNSGVHGHKSKYTCKGCNLPMNVGDVAIFCERAGKDQCWHPACFSCFTCKELLADLIYFYKDGKVFCGRHFTESEEMPRCKSCDELIFGNAWTRADGFDWHIDHFCCNVCDTPMAGQRYVPDKNGYPYCLPCYMSCVAKMCEGCEQKISPEMNRCGHRGYFYHATPECFRCFTCQDTLLGKRFKMSKNWVFCSNECIQKAAEELEANSNPKVKEEM